MWTFYNASGEALTSFGPVALTDLDIDGGTDVGEAIVDADLFIIDNGAGGTNVKTAASRIKTYAGVTQANEAALEAETNEDTYAPPDLIKHSPGVAKAWAVVAGNGTLASPSYNMTSTSTSATGTYVYTFDVDFSDADYTGHPAIRAGLGHGALQEGTQVVGSVTIRTWDACLSLADINHCCVFFGDQ